MLLEVRYETAINSQADLLGMDPIIPIRHIFMTKRIPLNAHKTLKRVHLHILRYL